MPTELSTPAAALAAALRADPNGPLLTYYDDRTGERTELSARTLDNWVCKTANLLVDGCGLSPEDAVAVLLPAHWQSAAVLLGCLTAGTPVRTALPVPDDAAPAEVAFTTPERIADTRALRPAETYLLGLAPLGAPLPELPDGAADYVVEVRAFGDNFPAPTPDPDGTALLDRSPVSHRELVERAANYAGGAGLHRGGRLLITVDAEPDPLVWLLAPLVAGASVVLCRNATPERLDSIAADEQATVRI